MSDTDRPGGFRCPACGARQDRVLDTRGNIDGTEVRRRRVCDGCGERWTTHERIEPAVDTNLFNQQHGRAKVIAAELREMATALERW